MGSGFVVDTRSKDRYKIELRYRHGHRQAIDATARRVTLRNEKGEEDSFAVGEAAFNRAKSALPGGTLATQEKRTVTVKAVDLAAPSITYTQALLTNIDRAK